MSASSSSDVMRKRSAVEAAFEGHSQHKQKLQRVKKMCDLEEAVSQAIRDNLRSLSSEELDGLVFEGLACRQRLRRDKEQWLSEDRKGLKMGGCYYAWLRSKYQAADNPRTQLALQWEDVPARLRAALGDAAQHVPRRGPLLAYVKSLVRPCRADVVALFRYLCRINPGTSMVHLEVCTTILSELARCDVFKDFAEEIFVTRAKFDDPLAGWLLLILHLAGAKVHKIAEGTKMTPDKFFSGVLGVWMRIPTVEMRWAVSGFSKWQGSVVVV